MSGGRCATDWPGGMHDEGGPCAMTADISKQACMDTRPGMRPACVINPLLTLMYLMTESSTHSLSFTPSKAYSCSFFSC